MKQLIFVFILLTSCLACANNRAGQTEKKEDMKTTKDIYLAGGCFWGTEHFLKLIDGVETQASAFTEYRAERNNPIPLLYQSGYLTIKEYDPRFKLYKLEFPNEEVRYGFLNFITPFYSSISDEERGVR